VVGVLRCQLMESSPDACCGSTARTHCKPHPPPTRAHTSTPCQEGEAARPCLRTR
jgi:hypothetical protein